MGKVDTKKVHKSDKVPLAKSAKSKINLTLTINRNKVRKPPTCSICLQEGHNMSKCKYSPW